MPIQKHKPIIRHWLSLCLVLIAVMVGLGGATRLTESGLSIVEWKLVTGVLPPLTHEAWDAEFAAYKTSPQYQKVNAHFGLEEFKNIYWLEYLHRLLGRIIGLVMVIPFAWFALHKQLSPALTRRMAGACLLVALQGTVGWLMVASGLKNEPRVEPIKLALHLSLAFTLFCYLLWTWWQVAGITRAVHHATAAKMARAILAILGLQIVLGALVAGLRAGLTYTTWPLMDGVWIPQGLHLLEPWWKNHLENVLTVQFQHRVGAYLSTLAILMFGWYVWQRLTHLRPAIACLLGALTIQFSLGVATLLTHVNIVLAVAHQLGALLLLSCLVYCLYALPLDHGQGTKRR